MGNKPQLSDRNTAIQRNSWLGLIGNGLLAFLKIVVGFVSGSVAVIADGIDSASDILGSLITLLATRISENPPDKEHPWGYRRVETIATKMIAMFILFAGLQLLIGTTGSLIRGEARELPGHAALVVTVISILGKTFLAATKYRVAKQTGSSMVRADAINMTNDIILSFTVLIGLGITYLTHLPMVDTILGLLLSLWIIRSGILLAIEANWELMDSIRGQEELYQRIFDIAANTPGVMNPHKARIRKLNIQYDITLDIEVDGNLSVAKGHQIARHLEQNIKKAIPDVFDVIVHVEPVGNKEKEQFGLSPDDFENNSDISATAE